MPSFEPAAGVERRDRRPGPDRQTPRSGGRQVVAVKRDVRQGPRGPVDTVKSSTLPNRQTGTVGRKRRPRACCACWDPYRKVPTRGQRRPTLGKTFRAGRPHWPSSPGAARPRPSGDQSTKSTEQALGNSSMRQVPAVGRHQCRTLPRDARRSRDTDRRDHCHCSVGTDRSPRARGWPHSEQRVSSHPGIRLAEDVRIDRFGGVPRNIGRASRSRLGAIRRPR